MVDTIGNFIGGKYRDIAKGFMTVLKESKFYEEGVLTPEEYTKAGDYLTSKCPTWKWCSNKENCPPADYLLKDKQYLFTSVPCADRVKSYVKQNTTNEKILDSDWVETNIEFSSQKRNKNTVEVKDTDLTSDKKQVVVNIQEDYMGIEGIEQIEESPSIVNNNNDDFIIIEQDDNITRTRMYDVIITYDFYYRVPRLWLVGYGENGNPLSSDEVKEDIMMEYIDRTVTIEKLPNVGIQAVSIHPCKHSLLLKKMISNFEQAGKKLLPEQSIIVFLKFLHSVVPTINYDFTMDIEF